MALTGPQKYPSASTAYWYQDDWGGDSMESNTIVWHTTEGTSVPDYANGAGRKGALAPNLTAFPNFSTKRVDWYQHFGFDTSARALVHAGSVATNTLNVCQIELVGTCDPSTHSRWTKAGIKHLYAPELPDWVIRDLAAFCAWAHDQHGVPLTSGVTFKSYPDSYGTDNGVRMSDTKWLGFSGHCGHQHVPSGNVHGDPGLFPMQKILSAALGGAPAEEDPLATWTKDDLFAAVWAADKVSAPKDAPDYKTNPTWQPQSFLKDTNTRIRGVEKQVAAQNAAIGELVKTVAQLAANAQAIDPDALVARIKGAIESVTVRLDVPGS
jgi:hypothetical protein